MHNPFSEFTWKEYILWVGSMAIVLATNLFMEDLSLVTLIATLLGVTSLIFAAKGDVIGPILMVVFSILYGITSYRFQYWGEMITYLGMTMPASVLSVVAWLKNPFEGKRHEVTVEKLSNQAKVLLILSGVAVTALFYFLLRELQTPFLLLSTVSVTTSYFAVALTFLRSPFYAVWYATNDVVLIGLWIYASIQDVSYIPMIVNFVIFLVNDSYGFLSWRKREKRQRLLLLGHGVQDQSEK